MAAQPIPIPELNLETVRNSGGNSRPLQRKDHIDDLGHAADRSPGPDP